MPTTSNFGWTTPADTDLVKDGALAIRTLGNGIDTSMAQLKGGTTGQVLSKTSNTDMAFTWVTQDDANAIQNAIVDAKGDLIAATANDTPARLAVGTNNFFLRANSSASTGLEWAGSVTTFTPILNQNGNVATSGATGKYLRVGNFIYGTVIITANANGSANNKVRVTLPLTASVNNVFIPVGQGAFYDASSFNVYPVQVVVEDGTYFSFPVTNAILTNGGQYLGQTQFIAALAASDQLGFSFAYEVA